jgi:DNA-binding MarR family transcriptional regulator
MSFIDEMGSLYLASRLERLSERFKKDAAIIYKQQFKDIKYKWYPALHVIHMKSSIGVVELANELSYAHPTIIDTLKELEQKKMITSVVDKKDKRKKVVSLTAKGQKIIETITPLTIAFEKEAAELVENKHHLLKAIEAVEKKLDEEDLASRINKRLKRIK